MQETAKYAVTEFRFPEALVLTSNTLIHHLHFDAAIFSPVISVPSAVTGQTLSYKLSAVVVHQPAHFVSWFHVNNQWVYSNDMSAPERPDFVKYADWPSLHQTTELTETVEFLLYVRH
jgi:hypothetical protein